MDGVITYEGKLDETVSSNFFTESLLALGSEHSTVKMDFSGVSSGNSVGIRFLHRYLSQLDRKVIFKKVPLWLLEQFGMQRGFIVEGTVIESVYLPFYCSATEEDIYHVWKMGDDVPIMKDYETFEAPNVIVDGKEFEPDFDFESAFAVFTDI